MNDLDKPRHFIQQIIDEDLSQHKNQGRVHTRFPPEPNGYLHIGHAKAICLNFGLAAEYAGGVCNLRFDDTNPEKETQEYVDAIKADVTWLGFAWQDQLFHSSDYFQRLYDIAETMILNGDAYVCSLSADETRAYRGGLTEAGKNSPYRDRSVDENIDLFRRMRAGEFPDGAHVLRAKIDMASPNMNMRDPTLYRIRHVDHQRTGDSWRIYPMYDFTHSLSDAIEGITHSLCSLEFADHRPLYDWMVEKAGLNSIPAQYEFSRLELQYTITSKRKLNQLVTESYVNGWDDPRMPTVSGMRRRGYTAASIREFCARIGVTKSNNSIEMASLESCLREDLDKIAPRAMGVLRPLKIVLQNYDADKIEEITAANHPQQEQMGNRTLFFTRELYIDQDDFREQANRKYKRLVSGGEVRLRNAYVIKCEQVIKNDDGEIVELHCSCDLDTLGKKPEGRKVKGVIHWVSAQQSEDAEVRLYDRLFTVPHPDADSEKPFVDFINPDSLQVIQHARVEKSLSNAEVGQPYQFEREGYFCLDSDSRDKKMVFNRTVTLRDSWAKIEQK